MQELIRKLNAFLRTLRRSDEATKKKWVYAFSGAAIIFVIFLWIAYLNVTLPSVPPPPDATSTPAARAAAPEGTNSFFSVLGRGFKTIGSEITNGITQMGGMVTNTFNDLKRSMSKTNEYSVTSTASESSPAPIFVDLNATSGPSIATTTPNL